MHLPQAGLQMLWALLDAAIELVPDEHTKSYPERALVVAVGRICFSKVNQHGGDNEQSRNKIYFHFQICSIGQQYDQESHGPIFMAPHFQKRKKKNMSGIGQVKTYDDMLIQLH